MTNKCDKCSLSNFSADFKTSDIASINDRINNFNALRNCRYQLSVIYHKCYTANVTCGFKIYNTHLTYFSNFIQVYALCDRYVYTLYSIPSLKIMQKFIAINFASILVSCN